MSAVKRKNAYHFNEEWELAYFCLMVNNNCTCLICNLALALPNKGNIEIHFMTRQSNYNDDFPLGSEVRKIKYNELKSRLRGQQRSLKPFCTSSKATTSASFKGNRFLAKKGKAFSGGELLKKCFPEISDNLFQKILNKNEIKGAIKELELPKNTVMRRIGKMSENVVDQLRNDFTKCECFSLQLNESTDIRNLAEIVVFIRMVFNDCTVKEVITLML